MKSTPEMEAKLFDLSKQGVLELRKEKNLYLKASYRGAGGLVSEKWNVKIYTTGSVVCVDFKTLDDLLKDKLKEPDLSKELIQADDSGWGFPLGGVMVGICYNGKVLTDVVPVDYFRGNIFQRKTYLIEYANRGFKILQSIGSNPKTHRIEICTGFINRGLKERLREEGYDVVVTEIKGLLQDTLEDKFKEYIRELTGVDLAYDPKECDNVGLAYKSVVDWGIIHAPSLLKNGWKSLGGL